jgi:excisionase family DNA binding protein
MDTQESMLTTEDIANYLKVDVVTVRRLVSRGELAAYRVGAEFRFTLSDLQAYLKRQYVPVGGPAQAREQIEQLYGPYFLLRQIFATAGEGRSRAKPAVGERFTERARTALELSQAAAEQQRCGHIYASHLLLGLAAEPGGLASRALKEIGITSEAVRRVLAEQPQLTGPARDAADLMDIDAEVKRALEAAVKQAKKMSHDYIGTEHLLLGLLSDPKNNAVAVIKQLNVKPESLRAKVTELMRKAGT